MDERIRQMVEQLRPSLQSPQTSAPDGVVGELVVADGGHNPRVFLITSADSTTRTLGVMLATNAVEMATDLDMLIGAAESGAAYDLVVQAELYGQVFPEQLRKLVGKIDEATTLQASESLKSDGASLAERPMAGPPLVYGDDPRRAFKHEELEDLRAICSECRRFLIDGVANFATVDPSILLPPPPGSDPLDAQDRLIEILDLLDEFQKSGQHVLAHLFDLLSVEDFGQIDRWRTEFGFDLVRRVFEMADGSEIPFEVEPGVDDPQSSILQSLSNAEIPTVTMWTVRDEAWDGLRFEETDSGVCRASARLVGASA